MGIYALTPTARRFPRLQPVGPQGWTTLDLQDPQFAGLGKFLKKAAQTVSKIAHAPLKAIAPSLGKKLEALDNKVINKLDDIHTDINKFFKRNWKWVIVAAAIALTIYTMGSGASIAAKMMSGLIKVKAMAVSAGAKMLTWKSAIVQVGSMAMQKLLNGSRYGDLSSQEVDALGNMNAAVGEQVVPSEVTGILTQGPGASGLATTADGGVVVHAVPSAAVPAASAQAMDAVAAAGTPGVPVATTAPGGPGEPPPPDLPPWVIPSAIGVGALILILLLRR